VQSLPLATGAWLELDLLRRRREELGLQAPKPVPAKKLLLKGSLIGGGLVLGVLAVCGGALVCLGWLDAEKSRLAPAADAYDQTQLRLGRTRRELKTVETANKGLADAIAGVRSGSALLSELRLLVPRGLQFTKLQVLLDQLTVNGLVNQPIGLGLINAFELQLRQSAFFQPTGVALVKATESMPSGATSAGSAGGSSTPAAPPPPKQLSFELKATFASDAAKLTRDRLAGLGSLGLSKRVQLLRQEGLLP
jgi:Tfp pilus assembly protein PilN